MNKDSDKNSLIHRINYKVTMWMMTGKIPSDEHNTTHNHGFSYVAIFKIVNLLAAILVFIIAFLVEQSLFLFGYGAPGIILLGLLNLAIAFIVYWILTLPIKLFENIAIIAKNSTDIRNKLYK